MTINIELTGPDSRDKRADHCLTQTLTLLFIPISSGRVTVKLAPSMRTKYFAHIGTRVALAKVKEIIRKPEYYFFLLYAREKREREREKKERRRISTKQHSQNVRAIIAP